MKSENAKTTRSLYRERLAREKRVQREAIDARMRWEKALLAQNKKCSVSLDLPIINCKPSKACSEVCYACQGRQAFNDALIKSLAVNEMIRSDPERAARKMVDEAAGRPIRLSGSGELLPEHKTLVEHLERFGAEYWGFTRRIDTHKAIPRLMFSFDATSCEAELKYARKEVPIHRRAYLRRPGDQEAPFEVAVTFPVHGPRTMQLEQVPYSETDWVIVKSCGLRIRRRPSLA